MKKTIKFLLTVVVAMIAGFFIAFAVLTIDVEPSILLKGPDTINVEVHEKYQEPGVVAYAVDKAFGKKAEIKVDVLGKPDVDKLGEYEIVYSTKCLFKKAEAKRTVKVVDTTPPVITLVETDKEIDPDIEYIDAGYKAIDNYDGDITDKVVLKRDGNKVLYSVTDKAGNEAKAERELKYIDMNHVIYLTFDDGPSQYTEKLLDILDKYDVKVTFFVTGVFSDYSNMIGEAYKRGHKIAVHSYTHNYNWIYLDDENYLQDFNKIMNLVKQQTGFATKLMRFPGGTGNTVSYINKDPGIMTRLTRYFANNGYVYFDWNVSSGDAGATTDTDVVYQNVVDGIKGLYNCPAVVLQHDTKGYSVDAVERIIIWGKENGYIFKVLSENGPRPVHGIRN